jgi:O-antigen/teichoic acid export membrane protein
MGEIHIGFSLKERVARSMFWIAWSRGVAQVLSFATTLLVARILVPADYGVMALASVLTGSVGLVAEMGLGAAIIQFRDLERREIDTCFWITMTLAAVGWAALSLSAPIIAAWFDVPSLAQVLPVLALVLPLTSCRVVSDSLLRKRLAFDRVSQAEVIGALVTLPVMVACALAGLGVWTLVLGALLAQTVCSAATFALAPWRPGFRLGGKRAREMLHFSFATLGARVLWVLREKADQLIVAKLAGQVVLGFYAIAKDLACLPGNKISTVVNSLASPIMAELQTDVDKMRVAFYRGVRLTAAITLPTSAGMALVANEMVALLLGPKWLPSAPLLRLLCLYAAVRAIDVFLPPVLFARRRERFLFWYFFAQLVVVPAAAVLGALWNGAQGLIVFSTPVYCVVMVIMAKEALAEMGTSVSELWAEIWPILGATGVMTAVVVLVRELALAGRPTPAWVGLVLLSISGAVAYSFVLYAIDRSVIGEGAEVARWILRRGSAGG